MLIMPAYFFYLYVFASYHMKTDASNRINGKKDVQILDLTFHIFLNSILKFPLVLLRSESSSSPKTKIQIYTIAKRDLNQSGWRGT